jgi:hypothetical protein
MQRTGCILFIYMLRLGRVSRNTNKPTNYV